MSSSRQVPLPVLALLAMALSPVAAAKDGQTQSAADPAAGGASARDFLATLIAGKCGDPTCEGCNPSPQANGDSQATEGPAAAAQDSVAGQAAQETLVTSGGISMSACWAVGLTDADTGEAAQIKGAAAALITGLEDLRDRATPGSANRQTAEDQIGAVAQACSWAVPRLPKQAA